MEETAFERYARGTAEVADELLRMLERAGLLQSARDFLDKYGMAPVLQMSDEQRQAALSLVASNNNSRYPVERLLAGEDPGKRLDAFLLVLRARYFGVVAARSLATCARLEALPGQSYRSAARQCAELVCDESLFPDAGTLLLPLVKKNAQRH